VLTQSDLLALADKVLLKNNRPQPVVFERGRGCEVWDVAGKRYLDMTAGIAVCGLGHGHPMFSARVTEQLLKLVHISNLYYNENQILAAKAIVDRSFADRVFFCNSGGEANEGALKLARRYQSTVNNAPNRLKIVSTHGSFHGRTFATVSITGQPKYREGFGPMVENIEHIDYGDLEAAKKALEGKTACCIIVEPIQAEGGIIVPPAGYLAGLRKLCDETGTILIFDEVMTGLRRKGPWFAYESTRVIPDVMTLAKGLGGGIPIGAVAMSEKAAQGLTQAAGGAVPHATTFGGNPLACAAALATLDIIETEGLLDRVNQAGIYLNQKLEALVAAFPGHAVGTRGRALLPGLGVRGLPAQVTAAAREKCLLASGAGDKGVRFAPPFIVEREQLDEATSIVREVLEEGVGK